MADKNFSLATTLILVAVVAAVFGLGSGIVFAKLSDEQTTIGSPNGVAAPPSFEATAAPTATPVPEAQPAQVAAVPSPAAIPEETQPVQAAAAPTAPVQTAQAQTAPAPQAAQPEPVVQERVVYVERPRPRENCEAYLYGTRTDTGRVVKDGVIGGALGAGTGAGIGAIAGNAGKGAGIGALVGVVGGSLWGVQAERNKTAQQRAAYQACLARNAR